MDGCSVSSDPSVVVRKEPNRKAKPSLYIPTLTYGHKLWVATERTRSQTQTAEMSFLCRMSGLSFIGRVRSSVTWEGNRVELLLLCIEGSQMRWLGHLEGLCLPGPGTWECFGIPLGRARQRSNSSTDWFNSSENHHCSLLGCLWL